jgi:hypothetical protein
MIAPGDPLTEIKVLGSVGFVMKDGTVYKNVDWVEG